MADNTKPIPPVPNKSDLLEPGDKNKKMSATWIRWMIQLRDKINLINATIASLSGFSGSGFISADGTGGVNGRTIQGTTGRISVTNGDGVAADPVVDLVDTAVTPGSFTNTNLTVDASGRITAAANGSAAGSPLTTKGDLFGFDTADARVPVGTNGYVLTADSTSPTGVSYQPPGTPTLPVTTKGDILGYSTVPARVPVGTDGQVLVADSTQALGLKWTNFSSSSVPYVAADVPLASSFTLLQSTPNLTLTDKTGRLVVQVPSAGTRPRCLLKTLPSPPYTIDLGGRLLGTLATSGDAWAFSLALSDGTKIQSISYAFFNNQIEWSIDNWSNTTTFSSNTAAEVMYASIYPIFLRLTSDGTTNKFYISYNGLDFVLFYSYAYATFLTPTLGGIELYNNSARGNTAVAEIFKFTITNSILGDAA